MEKAVYKYKLENKHCQFIELPIGSEFLTADTQLSFDQFNPSSGHEDIYVWFIVPVDKSIMKLKKEVLILATGDKINCDKTNLVYLKTVFLKKNQEVYHLFEPIR